MFKRLILAAGQYLARQIVALALRGAFQSQTGGMLGPGGVPGASGGGAIGSSNGRPGRGGSFSGRGGGEGLGLGSGFGGFSGIISSLGQCLCQEPRLSTIMASHVLSSIDAHRVKI